MVKGWQVLSDGMFSCRSCVLSFPLCGNGLCKSLDSGLRRNDGKGGFRPAPGILGGLFPTCLRQAGAVLPQFG